MDGKWIFCLALVVVLVFLAVMACRWVSESYVGIPYGTYPGDLQVYQEYPNSGYTPGYVPLGTWRGWDKAPCSAGSVSVEAIIEARRAAQRQLSQMGSYDSYMPPSDAYTQNIWGIPRGQIMDLGANS